jgi:pyruvate dehydrogenase E1 component beta subunit
LFGENVSSKRRLATTGLREEFGKERVRDTPITETAFIGTGVGAAIAGMRPIVELMHVDFSLVAMDQILNQMAKSTYMSGGLVSVPMVIRNIYGASSGSGATHSESLYGLYSHIPGMKIVIPSNPYDAKGLLINGIRDNNPVVFFEHSQLYQIKGKVPKVPYSIPFGVASLLKEGSDITVVAVGKMLHIVIEAANELKGDIDVEVIDPRTIVPLDEESIFKSISKTGRLVIVDEDYERCGFSAEIAAIAASNVFHELKSPIVRIANPNIPIPYNKKLENQLLPDCRKVVSVIRDLLKKSF